MCVASEFECRKQVKGQGGSCHASFLADQLTLFYPGKQIMPTPTLILPRIFKASYSHELERWLLEAKWCMTHTSTQILAGRPLACDHNVMKSFLKELQLTK